MKRKAISILLGCIMLLSVSPVWANVSGFKDVPDDSEFKRPVGYLAEQGIINGKSETEFCPDDSIKREEFAKILAKAFKLSEDAEGIAFLDTDPEAWYMPYVNAVSASGLMTGISETEFGVGLTLTRQDMAVTLKRFADNNGITFSQGYSVEYADSDEIADYAREAVRALSDARALRPLSEMDFCPTKEASRGVVAKAVYFALMEAEPKEHLDELAPTKLYEPSVMPKIEIFSEDFEDDDFGDLVFTEFHDHKEPIELDTTVGYESNGSAVLYEAGFPCLAFKTSDIYPGEVLELSYRVKGENMAHVEGERGNYRAICQIFDDEKIWLWESFEPYFREDTDGWVLASTTVMVPDIGNDLNPPEFYYVTICPYMENMTGTVHFDDFKISKILFDPMETVLMTPNYKGLIYGEGGREDINLRAYVYDMVGAYDLQNLSLTSRIVDNNGEVLMETKSDTVTEVMDVCFSSAPLVMGGDFWIQSILLDKNTGEEIQRQEWSLRKREEGFKTEYALDEYNRVLIDGEPDLPMIMYNTGGGTGNYAKCAEMLSNTVGHNLDAILESGFGSWEDIFPYDSETTRAWMANFEQADKQGIQFVGSAGATYLSPELYGLRADGKLHIADLKKYLTRKYSYMKEWPQLCSYYIYDEVDATKFGAEFHYANELIASLDLDHPTISAICDLQPNRPGVHAKTADFLGTDPYPVEGKETDDISKVYKDLKRLQELNPNRPCFVIAQAFRWTGRGDLRPPTKEEFRNMLFQSLCAGTTMINAYAYNDLTHTCPDTWEQDWENYMQVYDEVGEVEEIYLSVLPAPYYEVEGGGEWLNHMTRRYDGKSYLFTVNNQNEANTAKIYLDGVTEMTGKYSGKTLKADSDGWFTVPFEGYETEVFVYNQADYKSSHAELIRFGLTKEDGSGLIIKDADSESSCIVAGNVTKVNYSIKASDFAKLYINGKEVSEHGSLSLSGLDEIIVKVISEDGRFSAEKTYSIER